MYLPDVHSHLPHHLHTVAEAEHYALLSGTYYVRLAVFVEVDAADNAASLLVFEHPLGSVAEGNDRHTVATYGHCGRKVVHFGIAYALRSHRAAHPCVENACAVDAEKHSQTGLVLCVVNVGEGIYTTLAVVIHLAEHPIDHSRRTGCGCYLARIEHVKAKGVVRLVAGSVCYGRAFSQPCLDRSLCRHAALHTERGHYVGYNRRFETVIVEQEVGHTAVLEVPKHAFAQSAHRSVGLTAKT